MEKRNTEKKRNIRISLFLMSIFFISCILIGNVSATSWTDNFDGNDSQRNWTEKDLGNSSVYNFTDNRYEISTNYPHPAYSVDGAAATYINQTFSNSIIQAKIQRINEDDKFLVYLLGRMSPSTMSGYTLGVSSGSESNDPRLWLGKLTNGGYSNLNASIFQWGAENYTWYNSYLKFGIIGDKLYGKIWKENETEPTEWQVNATDSSYSSGFAGLMLATYKTLEWTSVNVAIDDYSFSNSLNEVWVDDNYTLATIGWNVTHFASIQNATNAIAENGTVHVASGTYQEAITISTAKVITLQGAGNATTIIEPTAGSNAITISSITAQSLTLKDIQLVLSGVGRGITAQGDMISTTIALENTIINYSQVGRGLSFWCTGDTGSNSINNSISLLNSQINCIDANGSSNTANRGISFYDCDHSSLTLTNSTVTAGHYALNIFGDGLTVNISNGSVITGYTALNLWTRSSTIDVDNSTLTGRTFWSGGSDRFGTIAFTSKSFNTIVNITNSIIANLWSGSAKSFESLIFSYPTITSIHTGNKVYLDDATQLLNTNSTNAPCSVGATGSDLEWYINNVLQENPEVYNIYVDDVIGNDTNYGIPGLPKKTIQGAIDVRSDGDTIYVAAGIYAENIVIDKELILVGENKTTTIIDGGNSGVVVNITANDVSLSEFTVKNSGTTESDVGIGIQEVSGVNIYNNLINNNTVGVALVALATNNSIYENSIYGNTQYGIKVDTGTTGDPLNATYNYWGDFSGPGGIADGLGNNVSENVTYYPYYRDSAMTQLSGNEQTTINETIDVTQNSTDIDVIENNTASNITIPRGIDNVDLDLSKIINSSGTTVNATLTGSINIRSNTSVGLITVEIPENVTISGNSSWNGIITTPTVKEISSVTVTADSGYDASVSKVIGIGFPNIKLSFDKAVRIVIEGQAGQNAGYSQGGVFTKISNTCSGDSQIVGDALVADGDCKINSGDDLVIWTKHFTKFITYSQTVIIPETQGNGGGSNCLYDLDFDWGCSAWGECVDGVQNRSCKRWNNCGSIYGRPDTERSCTPEILEIPEQLFDITWSLDDASIQNVNELVGTATFESFGTVPTSVNLTFVILDRTGNEIYTGREDIVVVTEEFLRWEYEDLEELPDGKYTAILKTLYNTNVEDDFRQEFEISKKRIGITGRVIEWTGGEGKWYGVWIIGLILIILIILIILFFKKRNSLFHKKKRKKK